MLARTLVAALLGAIALTAGPGATAQEVRNLDGEQSPVRTFPGRISDGPLRYSVTVPADAVMQIDAVSTSDLDPILRVFDADTEELLIEDDDGGDELNARATIRGTIGDRANGRRIVIEVASYSYEGFEGEESLAAGGAFDLRLSTRDFEPQAERAIGWGASESGTLLAGEEHRFRFSGEPGMLLEAVLLSADEGSGLDPYLELHDEAGTVLASDDDGAGGLNALLRHVLDSDGEYTVVASGFGDSAGAYTLRVAERREPVAQAPEQMIGLGETASGMLGQGYENGGVDPATISYRLDDAALAAIAGGAGAVTFVMEAVASDDPDFGSPLDPFIELGFEAPLGFAVVDSDDDGAGDLGAMMPIDLGSIAGDPALLEQLRIRVSGYGSTGGGYTFSALPGLLEPGEPLPDAE